MQQMGARRRRGAAGRRERRPGRQRAGLGLDPRGAPGEATQPRTASGLKTKGSHAQPGLPLPAELEEPTETPLTSRARSEWTPRHPARRS